MLWTAIAEAITPGFAAAASPLAIIVAVMFASSPAGVKKSLPYAVGFFVALATVATLVLVASNAVADAAPDSEGSQGRIWLKFILGLVFFVLAVTAYRKRPREGEEPKPPKLLAALDKMSIGKVFGLGVIFGIMPKDLAFSLTAGTDVGAVNVPFAAQLTATVVYGLIGMVGVLAPSLVVMLRPAQAKRILSDTRAYLTANQSTIMILLYSFMCVKQLSASIGPLFGG